MLMTAPSGGDSFTGVSGSAYTAADAVTAVEIGGADVRQALQRNWSPKTAAGNRQISGVTHTLRTNDWGSRLSFTSSSAVTVTVPAGLPPGFEVIIEQLGSGKVTLSPSGTTINNTSSLLGVGSQYGVATLLSTGVDTYNWVGNTG